jgi:four helix bundle protein
MNDYQKKLKQKMDQYVHAVYRVVKKFPKDELYGVTSQYRRAALSIVLNYIEGHGRGRELVKLNFFEISLGSYRESEYLSEFVLVEGYITKDEYESLHILEKEIGAMLWTDIQNLKEYCKKNGLKK